MGCIFTLNLVKSQRVTRNCAPVPMSPTIHGKKNTPHNRLYPSGKSTSNFVHLVFKIRPVFTGPLAQADSIGKPKIPEPFFYRIGQMLSKSAEVLI